MYKYALLAFALLGSSLSAQTSPDSDWPAYGGDPGGQRFSSHAQINTGNVQQLQPAWTFHTGVFNTPSAASNHRANFEATPVLWHRLLFFDTPFDQIFAVDAVTGAKVWTFDPGVDRDHGIYIVASRGVALWHGHSAAPAACAQDRVFVATLDRRLIARDALTGSPCEDFGTHGILDLTAGLSLHGLARDLFGFTSPPTVVGDVVIVGSSIGDNQSIAVAPGTVRAFNVRTGQQVWSWDPIRSQQNPQPIASGGAWSIIAADPERDILYIPTGSPATDYFGGLRPGDNRDADSIVALKASTGQRLWAFQLVHHDLWDYDTPSEPLLFTFRGHTPAVAVTTKTGMIFAFNRVTGEPLFPIEERPVPQSDLAGEHTWPTQPFSTLPTLNPLTLKPEDITFKDAGEQAACRERLAGLVNKGLFTPPGLKDALLYPGPLGGANWGSAGFDPRSGTLFAHTNNLAYSMRQTPRRVDDLWATWNARVVPHLPAFLARRFVPIATRFHTPDGGEYSPQAGTPYTLHRGAITTAHDTPCTPQPWASLVAINLNTGKKMWSVPQGTSQAGQTTGSIGVGGPVVTAGNLVFIGATLEPLLRAFDSGTGAELWKASLPAPANATPMTYQIDGRQFVVIAAGGNGMLGTAQADTLLAFALPTAQPARPPHAHRKSASTRTPGGSLPETTAQVHLH